MEPLDAWSELRRFTAARIALGRAGGSVPTTPLLDFRLAHARARDAVWSPFYPEALAAQLTPLGLPVLSVASAAPDRATYLQRPDLGRRLADSARSTILATTGEEMDLVFVVSDGLSTLAAMQQVRPTLDALLPLLTEAKWKLGPIVIVQHGRVAVQDEIGARLNARISLMLLGERPGLGSPDSLGAYFTYQPAPGRSDADRNCVSNIRSGGLPPAAAARKLFALLSDSKRLALSGVQLKDETPADSLGAPTPIAAID